MRQSWRPSHALRPIAKDLVFFFATEPPTQLPRRGLRPHLFLEIAEEGVAALTMSGLKGEAISAFNQGTTDSFRLARRSSQRPLRTSSLTPGLLVLSAMAAA